MNNSLLSKPERFLIKNRRSVLIVLILLSLVVFTAMSILFHDVFILYFFATAYGLIVGFVETLAAIKFNKLTRNFLKTLDATTTARGVQELMDLSGTKYIYYPYFVNNLITSLICLGEFQRVEELCRSFFQSYNLKRVNPYIQFTMYVNFADVKVMLNEKGGYETQLANAIQAYKKVKSKKSELVLKLLMLQGDAVFGEYKENFEQSFTNSLPRSKKLLGTPAVSYDICTRMFTYFKRFDKKEKAEYYAKEILKLGNDQLYTYRLAKEYLENANKGN